MNLMSSLWFGLFFNLMCVFTSFCSSMFLDILKQRIFNRVWLYFGAHKRWHVLGFSCIIVCQMIIRWILLKCIHPMDVSTFDHKMSKLCSIHHAEWLLSGSSWQQCWCWQDVLSFKTGENGLKVVWFCLCNIWNCCAPGWVYISPWMFWKYSLWEYFSFYWSDINI